MTTFNYIRKKETLKQNFEGMKNFMVFVKTDYEKSGVKLRGVIQCMMMMIKQLE